MITACDIVDSLLEDGPEDFSSDLERYSADIAAEKARGTVNYQAALDCDHFYHRRVRYAGRGKKPGTPYEARRNGATKTWKTRPGEFRIPIKIGFRGYGYIDNRNADEWATRPDFKEAWEEYAEQTRKAQAAAKINALQSEPLKPQAQTELPIPARDPNQPELFNENRTRLRKLGLY